MPDSLQRDVEQFHRACDLFIADRPGLRRQDLLAGLIEEEARETLESITGYQVAIHYGPPSERGPDLINAIDGLCDLLCVLYGAALMWGIDIEPFWKEILRTNLAKQGGPRRSDGKQLRPAGWEPPNLVPILDEQRRRPRDPMIARINRKGREREEARRRALHGEDQVAA